MRRTTDSFDSAKGAGALLVLALGASALINNHAAAPTSPPYQPCSSPSSGPASPDRPLSPDFPDLTADAIFNFLKMSTHPRLAQILNTLNACDEVPVFCIDRSLTSTSPELSVLASPIACELLDGPREGEAFHIALDYADGEVDYPGASDGYPIELRVQEASIPSENGAASLISWKNGNPCSQLQEIYEDVSTGDAPDARLTLGYSFYKPSLNVPNFYFTSIEAGGSYEN